MGGTLPDGLVGSPPDVVYVLRETHDDNAELRWSLRSLVNVPHGQVWIVGHLPKWATGVNHLPRAQDGRSKYDIQRRHMAKACRTGGVSDMFYLFNDDFFVVAPVARVPVWHRGPMLQVHQQSGRSRWLSGIRETAQLLRKWGIEDPLSYELHVPMPVAKAAMDDALGRIPTVRHGVQMRSVYGNVAGIGGVLAEDVKNRALSAGCPFVSTSDRSWSEHRIGADVRALFPEPGRYEK